MKILVDKLPEHPEDCCFAEPVALPSIYKCSVPCVQGCGKRCYLDTEGVCPHLMEIAIMIRSGEVHER